MGTEEKKDNRWGKFVTVAEYKAYLSATKQPIPKWVDGPEDERITCVTANEADAYAEWAGVRLLTEDELSDYKGDCTWTSTKDASYRLALGGSWGDVRIARVSYRYAFEASIRIANFGFRLAGKKD
jgi:formylglycine-generating enzyme required for sulfatase activity